LTALALAANEFAWSIVAPPGLALNQTTLDWKPTAHSVFAAKAGIQVLRDHNAKAAGQRKSFTIRATSIAR